MADPKLTEISAALDDANASLVVEKQQVADLLAQKDQTITGLNGIISDLQAQVEDGGSAADRQAVLDKAVALKASIETTVEPPVTEPPIEG